MASTLEKAHHTVCVFSCSKPSKSHAINTGTHDPYQRLRLLECWLPLAQDLNQQQGWSLDAPALESLILSTAATLSQTGTVLEARSVLWFAYWHSTHPLP